MIYETEIAVSKTLELIRELQVIEPFNNLENEQLIDVAIEILKIAQLDNIQNELRGIIDSLESNLL